MEDSGGEYVNGGQKECVLRSLVCLWVCHRVVASVVCVRRCAAQVS